MAKAAILRPMALPALVLACAGWAAGILADVYPMVPPRSVGAVTGSGEPLRHRQYGNVTFEMPLYTLTRSWLGLHAGPIWRNQLLWSSILVVLLLSAGALLGPVSGAVLGLSLLAAALRPGDGSAAAQPGYTLLVAVIAGLIVWRAQDRGFWRSLVLGAAIGTSFLYRSTLAFLPPTMAVYEIFAGRARGRRPWPALAVLCCVPYLFLVPWIRLNAVLHGRFVAFEHGEAEANIIAGALGSVIGTDDLRVGEAPWSRLRGEVGGDRKGPVLAWAAQEVLRHPIRYGISVARRLWRFLGFHPLLTAAAGLAFWINRRRPAFQGLALLCGYFVAIYSTMPVLERYFAPLWPVLALAVGSASVRPFLGEGRDNVWRRAASFTLLAATAAILVAALATERTVWSYASGLKSGAIGPASDQATLEGELAAQPEDIYLLGLRARGRLERGDYTAAVSDYGRIVALTGSDAERAEAAWAMALAGRAEPLLRLRSSGAGRYQRNQFALEVRQAYVRLNSGMTADANQRLGQALDRYFRSYLAPIDLAVRPVAQDRGPEIQWNAEAREEALEWALKALRGAPKDRVEAMSRLLASLTRSPS